MAKRVSNGIKKVYIRCNSLSELADADLKIMRLISPYR
jgi:hypothetical protein